MEEPHGDRAVIPRQKMNLLNSLILSYYTEWDLSGLQNYIKAILTLHKQSLDMWFLRIRINSCGHARIMFCFFARRGNPQPNGNFWRSSGTNFNYWQIIRTWITQRNELILPITANRNIWYPLRCLPCTTPFIGDLNPNEFTHIENPDITGENLEQHSAKYPIFVFSPGTKIRRQLNFNNYEHELVAYRVSVGIYSHLWRVFWLKSYLHTCQSLLISIGIVDAN